MFDGIFVGRAEALAVLKEAIVLSHEVNDNVCLQHAQAWLYKLTEENKASPVVICALLTYFVKQHTYFIP